MKEKEKKPKIQPFVALPHQYEIHGFEDSEGNYSPSYCIFVEHEYLPEDKILRIVYQSDGPSDENVLKFIKDRYKQLSPDEVKKIYYDKPWHFTSEGVAYGIILVMF